MNTLGLSDDCKIEIFQILALLIHMGNIKFTEKDQESCIINLEDEDSAKAFENTLFLTSSSKDELINLLTSIIICPPSTKRRYTMYRRDLKTPQDCRNRLFSIIRCLYDRLFHWLVDQVNEILSAKNENYNSLGILDIFGFESFAYNGLEQLCINYSNERLQIYFMEKYLEDGQRELEEEGLEIFSTPLTLPLYRSRMSVIENNLFTTINDTCQLSTIPDLSVLRQKIISKSTKPFLSSRNDTFSINHYSCCVEYSFQDVLDKNTDKIPTELSDAFDHCKNKLLNLLTANNIHESSRVAQKKSTTLLKLKESLDSLMRELNKSDAHYVRCVRPKKIHDNWMKVDFNHQLSCSGILDALSLAKCKFPIRLTFDEFNKRYFHDNTENNDVKLASLLALGSIKTTVDLQSNIHVGKHLIFLTEELFFEFEHLRKNRQSQKVPKVVEEKQKSLITESTGSMHDDVFLSPSGHTKKIRNQFPATTETIVRNVNNNLIEPQNCPIIRLNGRAILDSGDYVDSLVENDENLFESDWKVKEEFITEWIQNVTSSNDVSLDSGANVSQNNFPELCDSILTGNNVNNKNSSLGKFPKLKSLSFRSTEFIQDESSCIILPNNCRLFYKNRILSRRKLAVVNNKYNYN